MTLTYIGNGKHITGIPAQDLTDADISRIAGNLSMPETELITLLIQRGLYSKPPQVKAVKQSSEPPTPSENEVIE